VHESSLNALGYVQGGKKQKKWMIVSSSHGNAAIADYARYCYTYVKPIKGQPSAPQYVLHLPYTITSTVPSSTAATTATESGGNETSTIRYGNSDTIYGIRFISRYNHTSNAMMDILCLLTEDAFIEVPFPSSTPPPSSSSIPTASNA
jgi:hypothetical protein